MSNETMLTEAVAGRAGWDAVPEVDADDIRIWRTDGRAGVAESGRGWVVLDSDGCPADPYGSTYGDADEAVAAADRYAETGEA